MSIFQIDEDIKMNWNNKEKNNTLKTGRIGRILKNLWNEIYTNFYKYSIIKLQILDADDDRNKEL